MENKKHPKLMLVSEDGMSVELYIDGVKVEGAKAIRVTAYIGELVEHEVTYVTALSGSSEKE